MDDIREIIYDKRNNILNILRIDGDGREISRISFEYTYDEHGNLLKKQSLDRGIYPHARTEYSYDETGNLLTETGFNGKGQVYFRREYEYMAIRVG